MPVPDLPTLLAFIAAALSLNWTPGPDMLYVAARSVGQGRRAGFVSALGLSLGYVVHTLLAASGLAALLTASPAAYQVVRIVGGLYLAYLGVRAILSARRAADPAAPDRAQATGVFRQGFFTSALNPSVALFFLAFLPQFTDPARGAIAGQVVVLGLVFNTTATLTHTTVALLAGSAGDWLQGRHPGAARAQRWLTGGVLILLGARVLLGG